MIFLQLLNAGFVVDVIVFFVEYVIAVTFDTRFFERLLPAVHGEVLDVIVNSLRIWDYILNRLVEPLF